MASSRIMRRPEVEMITGLSKATLYRLAKRPGAFPRPIQLGPRAVGWRKKEIDEWLDTRERAGNPTAVPKPKGSGSTGPQ